MKWCIMHPPLEGLIPHRTPLTQLKFINYTTNSNLFGLPERDEPHTFGEFSTAHSLRPHDSIEWHPTPPSRGTLNASICGCCDAQLIWDEMKAHAAVMATGAYWEGCQIRLIKAITSSRSWEAEKLKRQYGA